MNEYKVNHNDKRLENIQRDDFDCFTFDSLSVKNFKKVFKGSNITLNDFIHSDLKSDNNMNFEKHILSKVRLIDNIVKNDPYTKAFLVFQTISWKIKKTKMPFILIPVRIFDEGTRVVKDGNAFINPMLKGYVEDTEFLINDKSILNMDNSQVNKLIEESNGRLIYEMYLTHFKIVYSSQTTKTNRKFVKLENRIDYLETNFDLVPTDLEIINIKKSLINGNNSLVNAKQGTKKVGLIVNLLSEFISRNKSILYISEKNYRSLKEEIERVGLSMYVDDKLDTNYTNNIVKISNDSTSTDKLLKTVNLLKEYQAIFKQKFKGVYLYKVFTELILLEGIKEKILKVDFFENIELKDVENIRETLTKIQLILKKEQYKIPAEEVWNDIDVRAVKYKENNVVGEITTTIEEINSIKEVFDDLKNDYGIEFDDDVNKLDESLANLDYMNSLQYPISWFVEDNFELAKKNLNKANTLAGRTQSLFTTINMSYDKNIFDIETEVIKNELFGTYFSDSDTKLINLLLESKMTCKTEIQKLQEDVEKLLYFKEHFSELLNVSLDDDFLEFVPNLTSLLLDSKMQLSWMNFSDSKKKKMVTLLNNENGKITTYLNLERDIKTYFTSNIDSLEIDFINEYIQILSGVSGRSPESKSITKLVEQFANGKYLALSKKRKLSVMVRAQELLQMKKEVINFQKKLNKLLDSKIELIDIQSTTKLFNDILNTKNPYSLDFSYDRVIIQELSTEFNTVLKSYRNTLKGAIFSKVQNLPLLKMESELDLFKEQVDKLLLVEERILGLFKQQPEFLTLQKIKITLNTVKNYQLSSDKLKSKTAVYSELFGNAYVGMDTLFKSVRITVSNFEKFKKLFSSKSKATEYFERREYKKVNESLYFVGERLGKLRKNLIYLSRNFNSEIRYSKLSEIAAYLKCFSSQHSMVKWVEFVDSLQSLRNYSQMKLAASINNGETRSRLVEQFNYDFYKKIVTQYYKQVNNIDVVNSMSNFNDLNRVAHNIRIENMQSLKRRKKAVLSNISGIEKSKIIYDLVIIDGAERIHSSYMHNLLSLGKTILVLFDEDSAYIDESIFNHLKHQPMYTLKHNYRLSPYLAKDGDVGVLYNQNIEIVNMMNVIEKVVDLLLNTNDRINVVCFDNQERVEIFNMINNRMLKMDIADGNKEFVNRLYVLLHEEYLPSSDVTFLIISSDDREGTLKAVNTTLRNSHQLYILDEGDHLEKFGLEEDLKKDFIDLFDESIDRLSKYVVSNLKLDYQVRKMISPYDFVIGERNKIYCMVKITFNNNTKSDILEETLMLFDKEYSEIPKYIISIDDLYFKQNEVIDELREVIEDGKRKQNES